MRTPAQLAALADLFDVPTLLAIEDACHMYARTLETFGATHPDLRADAERLRALRYVFADATAVHRRDLVESRRMEDR